MSLRPISTRSLFLSLLTLAVSSCSEPEPPPKPPEPPPEMYVPPPPPPIDDLVREAQEAEKVGNQIQSISALFGLEEAMRAYQRLANHYPETDEARSATAKVKELSARVREIRTWKKKIDDANKTLQASSVHVSRMPPLFENVKAMSETAPEGYIRDAVLELKGKVTEAYLAGVRIEVAQTQLRAEEIRKTGDLRRALAVFQSLPPDYCEDLPEIAVEVSAGKADLEKDAAEKAAKDIERADVALRNGNEKQAVAILRAAWQEFRGFGVASEIVARERIASIAEARALTAESGGPVRKLDLQFFAAMESFKDLRPDSMADREKLIAHLSEIEGFISKYGALAEEGISTHKESQIRKTFIEKLLRAERERLD